MESESRTSNTQWWKRIAEFTQIATDDSTVRRKGQLLALYILLIITIIVYILVDNSIYIYLYPSREYAVYILQELILLAIFMFFLYFTKRGWVSLMANIVISFTIIAAALTANAKYLEYIMIVFTLPVGISSFVIRPASSFFYAALTTVAYVVSSILTGYWWEYNLTAVFTLFALAFMTWAISQRLENALDRNDRLLHDVRRSNVEIRNAYEKTLEGWSRALEIRDKETEGHTRRVAELTLSMARNLGIDEGELVHIHNGALLHDIGKLGIPDSILLKPGKLTPEETAIMQTHTQLAREMLAPIDYLRPALDIPSYHHEKWDGTGYPNGLRGEDIPLSARIFAVIDVYDALSSDRPYRKAWKKDEVIEYIRSESGRHFDPGVVEVFMKTIGPG